MNKYAWMLAALGSVAGTATSALAQQALTLPNYPRSGSSRQFVYPCPTPADTKIPGTPGTPDPTQQAPSDDLLAGEGAPKNVPGGGTVVAGGTGLATAVNGAAVSAGNVFFTTLTQTQVSTPLILPGLFTASSAQSAIPIDRVSFDYGYFDRFQVTPTLSISNTGALIQPSGTVAGFNLHTFTFGVEKTFLNGMGSFYASIPLLYASDNITQQSIDGLGDVNLGVKFALLSNNCGSTLSAGLTVSLPTGRDATVSSIAVSSLDGVVTGVNTASTTVNPTFLQPWIAGIYVQDQFFAQNYFGIVVPTDSRVPAYLNEVFTTGYTIYRDRRISSLTPTFGAQFLIPVANRGTQPAGATNVTTSGGFIANVLPTPPPTTPDSFNFSDQLFLTGGLQVGLCERAFLTFGVVTPVIGPRGYSIGGTVGLNFIY